ncbi:u-box domain-containing protein [Venturia nashicola]|nr:u-box domain-containing protein [Venturia nashicola]
MAGAPESTTWSTSTRSSPRISSSSSSSSSFQFVHEKVEDYEDTDRESTVYTPSATIVSESSLPIRFNAMQLGDQLRIELHPLSEKDGILVSVTPPKQPKSKINHVPCDIVLVIDVSGSMGCDAPVPTTSPSEREGNGLSVLDLVKHAARTIIETLNENDRLGLVTFSTDARIVQKLLPMTTKNKKVAWARVEKLQVESMTNLWHGVLKGIKLFDDKERENTAAAVMILTDGMPNHMCPVQGYVPKLRQHSLPASLHTFGFGYSLKSGLLKSIAEIGLGNYAFIPDAGMIGTVFVHAIANLQSTFATSTSLTLTATGNITLSETMGHYAKSKDPETADHGQQSHKQLTIPLGNLQYGQSRDIILKYCPSEKETDLRGSVLASLDCRTLDSSTNDLFVEADIETTTSLPKEIVQYHRTRADICAFLSSIFPLSSVSEHYVISGTDMRSIKHAELEALIHLTESNKHTDELNASLLEDMSGPDPSGQIKLALSSEEYFNKWGKHYLLSLLDAHQNQICNSFKDPGPLMYGRNSPLFIKCRDTLDFAFDNLPPPKPSNITRDRYGNAVMTTVDVRQYNRRQNPCFAGECSLELADGSETSIENVTAGMEVWTPLGPRAAVAVVATKVKLYEMCRIGELVITDWHPLFIHGDWSFPYDVAVERELYTGTIYSLLLERDEVPEAHAIQIGGHLAVTLGHGMAGASSKDDARAHPFFGDYEKVKGNLEMLAKDRRGTYISVGVVKDMETGLVCGFIPTRQEVEIQDKPYPIIESKRVSAAA